MRKGRLRLFVVAMAVVLGTMAPYPEGVSHAEQTIATSLTPPAPRIPHVPLSTPSPEIVQSYGKLPLSFEANQGQLNGEVKFLSRGRGYNLFLTPTEAVLSLRNPKGYPSSSPSPSRGEGKGLSPLPSEGEGQGEGAVLRMQFLSANPSSQITGRDELPGKVNYFLGNDFQRSMRS